MSGELAKLSEAREQYRAGRRVCSIRQLRAPDGSSGRRGAYLVDGGGNDVRYVPAECVEQVARELSQAHPQAPKPEGTARPS